MGVSPLPRRVERFQSVIANRQYDLTIILENVHDPHNIGAVLRTCDSVGIAEIYIIYTDPRLQERGVEAGHKSSSGARQWVDIQYFENVEECLQQVRLNYSKIYSTHLGDSSVSLYDLALSESCALLFGNEHDGVSDEAQKYVDGNFHIPQHGFVQSLNISVACAVSLYEAQRQRENAGMYARGFGDHANDQELLSKYLEIHKTKYLKGRDEG